MQIRHLIYAKGLTTARRAQYVDTFHHNPSFRYVDPPIRVSGSYILLFFFAFPIVNVLPRILLMDLSQAAFGLDMREASRIYFINPVLNPQVEAQAIGRARRVSQKKPVSVETLVLRDSIDEVILERKQHMTQAEHRQIKSILDISSIYNWIKNASIGALPDHDGSNLSQMTPLATAQHVFGRGFGRTLHPDEGLVPGSPTRNKSGQAEATRASVTASPNGSVNGVKRSYQSGPGISAAANGDPDDSSTTANESNLTERPARRVRFAG